MADQEAAEQEPTPEAPDVQGGDVAPMPTESNLIATLRARLQEVERERDEAKRLLQQEWDDAAERHVTECHDCGLAYGGDGWIECVVPDDVWLKISPTQSHGGILCITCISRRLKRMGLDKVPVMLCGMEGIRVADQDEAFERGWGAAKHRIDELESSLASERSLRETAERRLNLLSGFVNSCRRRLA